MISREALLDVLRTHGRKRNVRDMHAHCLCGWVSDAPNGASQHLHHQVDELMRALRAAAGRGGAKPMRAGDPH